PTTPAPKTPAPTTPARKTRARTSAPRTPTPQMPVPIVPADRSRTHGPAADMRAKRERAKQRSRRPPRKP
ncbi:MAG: hypothetical protein WAL22_22485, partial [Solirubrobacteraceae bacterium]